VWAGLLAIGSSYSPRLPDAESVALVGFVTEYSGGAALKSFPIEPFMAPTLTLFLDFYPDHHPLVKLLINDDL
jgi:hypothetical protein